MKTHAQLDGLTDREVHEHFYLAYEPDTAGKVRAIEAEQAKTESEFKAKPLEVRKQEFWDLCRSLSCKEADIQRQWDEYLRTG